MNNTGVCPHCGQVVDISDIDPSLLTSEELVTGAAVKNCSCPTAKRITALATARHEATLLFPDAPASLLTLIQSGLAAVAEGAAGEITFKNGGWACKITTTKHGEISVTRVDKTEESFVI